MIIAQLVLLELVLRVRVSPEKEGFWNWRKLGTFVKFLGMVIVVLGLGDVLFGWNEVWVEGLGVAAMGLEAMLPVPTVIGSFRRKSMKGFSLAVLATWFFGDAFKTFYYITTAAPVQFLVCGIFQLCMDAVIVLEYLVFGNGVEVDDFA